MHAHRYVRMPRVAVPNHDQTHLINCTFTDPGKFKAVHSVAILIAHAVAVFQAPRVIITFPSDVGEKSRRRNAIKRINLLLRYFETREISLGNILSPGRKRLTLFPLLVERPYRFTDLKSLYIAKFLVLAMTHILILFLSRSKESKY